MEKPDQVEESDRASTLLARIRRMRPELRRSERKVADFVLERTGEVPNLSIARLAERVGVSEPTVIRFCRAMHCQGFQDFKLRLAGSLAGGVPYVSTSVDAADDMAAVSGKIFARCIATLHEVRNHLDNDALEQAVTLLSRARRIEFYGHGASGLVAADAQHKFFRLGTPAVAYSDPHVHSMSAATLDSDSVVVAISHTGRTVDLLESVSIAQRNGAAVVGITSWNSPLARHCTVSLSADVVEDTDQFTPMLSRMAHLAIVDTLAVGVALHRGPDLLVRLERVKSALRERRLRSFEDGVDGSDPGSLD